jgi:hypothetical protein
MNLTVLLEAKYIPNGSKVYKTSGTYPSILKDKISVYNESGKSESITTNGCKFLISETGNINAISENLIFLTFMQMYIIKIVTLEEGESTSKNILNGF